MDLKRYYNNSLFVIAECLHHEAVEEDASCVCLNLRPFKQWMNY